MSEYISNLEKTEAVVGDMLTNLFGQINHHAETFYARTIRKRFSNPQRYIYPISAGPDLRTILAQNSNCGTASLYIEEDIRKIESVAFTVGHLSVIMQSSEYDRFMDKRTLKVEDLKLSINAFVEDVWAPNYADQMAEAVNAGITPELVEAKQ